MRKITLFIIFMQFLILNSVMFSSETEKEEKIERTFQLSDQVENRQVSIDNVFGPISIKGVAGNVVKATILKTIKAYSQKGFARAAEEIRLEISQDQDKIEFYVDGPFRCHNGSINCRGKGYYGYEVHFNFELEVPYRMNITLKTVNDGEIQVKKITGAYEVNNINGGIEMIDIAGSGRIYALNGDVVVEFAENPDGDSYFGSLNGEINLYFQSPLSANFRLKTFNGEVYSDFPVTYLPQRGLTKVTKRGKNVFQCDKTFGVKAGNGGPEIELDAFNGDIHILERNN